MSAAFAPLDMDMSGSPIALRQGADIVSGRDDDESAAMAEKSNELLRVCRNKFFHEFHWSVPMPQVPATPMLFTPPVLKAVFEAEERFMNSDVDAMSVGVIDSIPLVHFPLEPSEIRRTQELIESHEREFAEKKKAWEAEGNTPRVVWPVEERVPTLDPKDLALVDTDIDVGLLEKRNMPSLTLLKRPLYTEIGLTPPDSRHQERLKHLIPPHLVEKIIQGVDESTGKQILDSLSQGNMGEVLSQLQRSMSQQSLSQQRGAAQADQSAFTVWQDGIARSFRSAATVDQEYHRMLDTIGREKLALGGLASREMGMQLAERFWTLLFDNTTGGQQRSIWILFCCHAEAFASSSETATPSNLQHGLVSLVEALGLPNRSRWVAFGTEYDKALNHSSFNRTEALKNLRIGAGDITLGDDKQCTVFTPDLVPRRPLQRNSSRIVDPTDRRTRLRAYPVSVAPLFPSQYDGLVASLADGGVPSSSSVSLDMHDMNFALRAAGVTQMVVHGVGDIASEHGCHEPHVIVNEQNLFLSTDHYNVESDPLQHHSTVRMITSANYVLEKYLSDPQNSTTLILEHVPSQNVWTYDFVRSRKDFRRNPAGTPPAFTEYVLDFQDPVQAEASAASRKRARVE